MIAKAKYKTIEALDPDWFCCDTIKLMMSEVTDIIFTVDTASKRTRQVRCAHCGAQYVHTAILVVEGAYMGYRIDIDVIDIDEGSVV